MGLGDVSSHQNLDYVVVSGASRKNEKWEHTEGETVAVEGHSEAQRLASDPMYHLEHSAQDQVKAKEGAPRIARIMVCWNRNLEALWHLVGR